VSEGILSIKSDFDLVKRKFDGKKERLFYITPVPFRKELSSLV
jgi:hypothetical protein